MRAQILNHYYGASCVVANSNIWRISIIGQLLIIFSLLLNTAAYPQINVKLFDATSGLSNNNVMSVVQDRSGHLWIGTRNGLNRFDGNTFKVYRYNYQDENSPASNFVSSLAVDLHNRIWMGHESSVTCFDPLANKFTRYNLLPDLPVFIISVIFIDRFDRIWIGFTSYGLVVLNPETRAVEKRIDLSSLMSKSYDQAKIKARNTISGISEDSLGNVWLATGDGLYRYDRKLDVTKPVSEASEPNSGYFKEIIADKREGFWLAKHETGICFYSPDQKSLNLIPAEYVEDIAWKNDNELWVITSDPEKPIGTYDIKSRTFSFLKMSDFFNNPIKPYSKNVFVDRTGIAWVSTNLGLIMVSQRSSWNFNPIFKINNAMNMAINAIVIDTTNQKNFIVTMDDSKLITVDIRNNKVRVEKGSRNPLYDPLVYSSDLLDTNGDSLWVISRDNIRLFDKVKEKWIDHPALQKMEEESGALGPSFYKMIRASTGDYWIITVTNGAIALSGKDFSFRRLRRNATGKNSICSNVLADLLEDKFGRIWFASRNAGISIFDPTDNSFKTLNNEMAGSSFIPTNVISTMDIDQQGNVWIATVPFGIFKYEVVSKDSLSLTTFDNEVITGEVNELEIDADGKIWFRSAQGVSVLDPQNMNVKTFDQKAGQFDFDHGLIKSGNRVFLNRYAVGLGTIDANDLLPDTTSYPVVLNSIKVFGNEIFPEGINHDHIVLPYDQNSLTIDFAAVDFLKGKTIRYSYKLEGLENSKWSTPSANRTTEFANLPGGDYIFKLKTSNQDAVWSKEKTLLYIHIETPFWETKWFYALLLVASMGMTGLFYLYQINKIKSQEREKSEINKRISQLQLKALHTQMRPHFIFNCLSAINSHIVKFETVKASEFLSQFSRLMRSILENSTESWITLEQEIETLRLYLVMESLRFEDKFSYKIEVDEGITPSSVLIPSMILQPYVENAIGHGILHKDHGDGIVTIRFLRGEGNVKCIVEDNGIGRERSSQLKRKSVFPRKSLGLQITSERLQLLQGSSVADIQDLKNDLGESTGTRIIVMLMTKKLEDKGLVNV